MRLILSVCLVAALFVVTTAIWPAIDLHAASWIRIPTDSPFLKPALVLREVFRFTPLVLWPTLLAFFGFQAVRGTVAPALALRRALFITVVFALGPGLFVNAGLKNYAHRPRPLHTIEAGGGDMPFRPWFRFDGGCGTNCSFSSGEAASSFWTTAPALLTPPPYRLLAVAGALTFGASVSALRMAVGAHFLSDVAFSALLVLALTFAASRLFKLP